jgi:hypothetical protein
LIPTFPAPDSTLQRGDIVFTASKIANHRKESPPSNSPSASWPSRSRRFGVIESIFRHLHINGEALPWFCMRWPDGT